MTDQKSKPPIVELSAIAPDHVANVLSNLDDGLKALVDVVIEDYQISSGIDPLADTDIGPEHFRLLGMLHDIRTLVHNSIKF